MPHASLKLKPGIDQNETPALNEAGISTSNLIRFIYDRNGLGLIQKLGGWTKFYSGQIVSIVRALWAWEDTNAFAHLAYGTQDIQGSYTTRLGCITNGVDKNITPTSLTANIPPAASTIFGSPYVVITDDIVSGITKYDSVFITTHISVGGIVLFGQYACDPNDVLALNAYTVLSQDVLGNPLPATATSSNAVLAVFTTTKGQATTTVTLPNHGYSVGSTYPVLVQTIIGGIAFYGNYVVQSVVDADNFTITGNSIATGAVPTSGPINGGEVNLIYSFGFGFVSSGAGYGTGLYGTGAYGYGFEIFPSVGNEIEAIDWTLDNWGQILISCPISSSAKLTITTATTAPAGFGFGYYGLGYYGYGEQIGTINYTPSYPIPAGQSITISGMTPDGWNGQATVIPAVEFYGTIEGCAFVGSISGNALTITEVYFGTVTLGQVIGGDGVVVNTTITGGSGLDWTVNINQNVPLGLIQVVENNILIVQSVIYGALEIGDIISGGDISSVTTIKAGSDPVWLLSNPQSTNGYGCYGFGSYGSGVYGIGSSKTKYATIRAGSTTIATTENVSGTGGTITVNNAPFQPVYQWDPTSGSPYATVIPNAPTVNDGVFVAMPQRQIIAWGSTFTGIQDPLLVRWCDVNNFNVWVGTVANQAGSYRIPRGSRIVGAIQGPQQGLIWTDIGVWSMQYIGTPYIYSFNEVGTGCGLIGRKAAASINGAVYWMGPSQFFSLTSSGVQPVPCPVWDVIFQDIDVNNAQKIRTAVNSLFGEIAWYYPVTTNAGEVTKYVKFNVYLGVWDFGTLARSAWVDQSVLGRPIGADPSSRYLYQHETSNDADGQSMPSSFTTGYFTMDDSDHKIFVDEVWPDMKWGFYGSPQNATVNMYFNATDFAGTTPTTYGPYPLTVNTTWFNPRFRGRLTSITLSNPADSAGLGTFWRIGNIRYRVQQDGKY